MVKDKQKIIKILWIVMIICVVILLLEGIFVIYTKLTKKDDRTYFDGINAFTEVDNNYIAVGSNNDNDNAFEKAKITKYNSKKEKVWEKLFNKGFNSSFFEVAVDGTDYIAVGNYEATKKEKKESVRSALIVKYDKSGNILFEDRFQVLGNSKFTNVKVVDDGYIVVGQSIYENMTLGLSEDGGAFVIKYDKEGKIVWKSNYGGGKSGLFNDVLIDGDYIYTVGKNYARTGVVVRYDKDGNFVNDVTYNYTDTLGFSSLVKVGDKIVVVGSKKTKEDDKDYDTDALIVMYDMDLNIIDESVYTGKGMERFNRVIVDSNNNIVMVGHTAVYNEDKSSKTLNVFSYDGIIAKYNVELKQTELVNYGDKMDDYFTDIEEDDGNYLVSGYSTYTDNSFLSKFVVYSKTCKMLEVIS